MTTAVALAERFRVHLRTAAFPPADPNGLWHGDGTRAVQRVGLALRPPADLAATVAQHRLDALWLHHPWRADLAALPPGFPVLAYHLSFDETMTPGYSPLLAGHFGLQEIEVLGQKDGRPLGMIGQGKPAPLAAWVDRARAEFGGYEAVEGDDDAGSATVRRVAFVGAFWPELVREAAERAVDLYVTGQLRTPGREALRSTGMTALAVGHARGEAWGLRRLAGILRDDFPGVEPIVLP